MSIIEINRDNFENEVLRSSKPVLLDFYADWCGFCKRLDPVIDEISKERSDIKVAKIDISKESELASRYGVKSIPALKVIRDGNVISSSVGMKPKKQIISMLM